MKKGERTRQRIIDESIKLFEKKGYAGCSISDIMAASRLQKGGIYNHFDSKESIALESLDQAFLKIAKQLEEDVDKDAADNEKLKQFIYALQYPKDSEFNPFQFILTMSFDEAESIKERAKASITALHKYLMQQITELYVKNGISLNKEQVGDLILRNIAGDLLFEKLNVNFSDKKKATSLYSEALAYFVLE